MNKLEVRGLYGQAITAHPEDVSQSGINVAFRNDNSHACVKFEDVRFPPASQPKVNLSLDLEVECFIDPTESASLNLSDSNEITKSNDSLTLPAWWKCTIVSFDINSCSVKLLPKGPGEDASEETKVIYEQLSKSQQLVQRSNIRSVYDEPFGIDLKNLNKVTINVPGYVAAIGKHPCAYKSFTKHFNSPVFFRINVENKTSSRPNISVTFFSPSKEVLDRVKLTIDNNWQSLSQKMIIISKKTRFFTPVRVPKLEVEGITETFEVLRSLVRFCIGHKGSNINEARKIPGIINIFVNDPTVVEYFENADNQTTVTIHAKDKEAAEKARAKLEYVKLLFAFPYEFTGHLIGRYTKNITSIIDKTQVISIFHDEDVDEANVEVNTTVYSNVQDNCVTFDSTRLTNDRFGAFIITGTKESVENAQVMLKIQVESICELNKLEQSEQRSAFKGPRDERPLPENPERERNQDYPPPTNNRTEKYSEPQKTNRQEKPPRKRDNFVPPNPNRNDARGNNSRRPPPNDAIEITEGLAACMVDTVGSGDAPANQNGRSTGRPNQNIDGTGRYNRGSRGRPAYAK